MRIVRKDFWRWGLGGVAEVVMMAWGARWCALGWVRCGALVTSTGVGDATIDEGGVLSNEVKIRDPSPTCPIDCGLESI